MEVTDFSNLTELDLRALDYRNMEPKEFIIAERQAQLIRKNIKNKKNIESRKGNKTNIVRIGDNLYNISDKDIMLLRSAGCVETMDKIKSRIVKAYKPISSIDDELVEAL